MDELSLIGLDCSCIGVGWGIAIFAELGNVGDVFGDVLGDLVGDDAMDDRSSKDEVGDDVDDEVDDILPTSNSEGDGVFDICGTVGSISEEPGR